MAWRLSSLIAACAAVGLQAQNVAPSTLKGVEGGSWTSIPFSFDRPARLQCIYDPGELPFSIPTVINGIALRPDNTNPGVTSWATKQWLKVSLVVSSTTVRAQDASKDFSDNWGSDALEVISGALISLPAVGPVAAGPMPFTIDLPFAKPFLFDATPVVGPNTPARGFLFDLTISVTPAGAYRLDTPGSCSIAPVPFSSNGPACVLANGAALALGSSSTILAGGTVQYTVSAMDPGMLFSVLMTPIPGGVLFPGTPFAGPVPYDLTNFHWLPGTPGAQDCFVEILPYLSKTGFADTVGKGVVKFTIPQGGQFVGMKLYGQALAFDPAANPLMAVTSNAVTSEVCGPLGIVRVFALADASGQLSTTGQVQIGNAAIIQFK